MLATGFYSVIIVFAGATYTNFRSFTYPEGQVGCKLHSNTQCIKGIFFYKTFKVGLKQLMFFVTEFSAVNSCNVHILLFLSDE